MHSNFSFFTAAAVTSILTLAPQIQAYDQLFGFDDVPQTENRTIDEIYQAALAEGGTVTLWHGGDAPDQQDGLKQAFEQRFPNMTLNVTVDFSKYHGGNLDRQLAVNNVYVDSIISQSLHDYPRWAAEGALLRYKPLNFEKIRPQYRDADAAYYGVGIPSWNLAWNTNKSQSVITGFDDFLKPEYKDKLVLTYPNDDDAVLFAFDLIMRDFGITWFEQLMAQNPRWVRGIETPATLIGQANTSYVATFTTALGVVASPPFNISFPTKGQFVTWSLPAAILKDAPHPEAAKLLHAFYLSDDYQKAENGFSVRSDITVPGQPFDASDSPNTDPTAFERFMSDRARIERLRYWFEDKLGTAQGLSPLKGGIY